MVDKGPGITAEAVHVRLFGREYTVRGHGNRNYIRKLADYIQARAQEVQSRAKVVATIDVAVLTLLSITDELFQQKQGPEEKTETREDQSRKLKKTTNRAV